MRSSLKPVGVVVGLFWFSLVAQARVADTSLDQLSRGSDVILVGEVQRVEVVAEVKIARVRAIQFVKGKEDSPISFIAEPTWTCDMSWAVPGERVLLYLNQARKLAGRSKSGQNLDAVQAAFNKEGANLYVISHSGRGRIPLILNKDRWVAPVTQGDKYGLVLNVNLYIPRPDHTFLASPGHRVVSLAELIARTKKATSKVIETPKKSRYAQPSR